MTPLFCLSGVLSDTLVILYSGFGTTTASKEVWFDSKRDTLYLGLWDPIPGRNNCGEKQRTASDVEALYIPEDLHDEDADRVQNLAIETYGSWVFDWDVWLARILQKVENLQKIAFAESNRYNRGEMETDLVFEDVHARELRNTNWWKYTDGYHPMIERILYKEYEEEVSELKQNDRDDPSEFEMHSRIWARDDIVTS